MKANTTSPSEEACEDSRMIDFLKLALKELEDAQGAPDAEAQQALRALQEQMRHLENAQRSASDDSASQPKAEAPSDIEIASSIDRLDEQLGALESKLRDADGQVQQLLGHSTALWLDEGAELPGQEETSSDRGRTGNIAVHADDADGPIQRRPR